MGNDNPYPFITWLGLDNVTHCLNVPITTPFLYLGVNSPSTNSIKFKVHTNMQMSGCVLWSAEEDWWWSWRWVVVILYLVRPTSATQKVKHQPRVKPRSLGLGSVLHSQAKVMGESKSPNAPSSSSSLGCKVSRCRSIICGSCSLFVNLK